MENGIWRRVALPLLFFAGFWLGLRYLLPIVLPFVLGLIFALMAEPGVKFLEKRLKLPRTWAAVTGIGVSWIMVAALIWIAGAAAYRELSLLGSGLPTMLEEMVQASGKLRTWAMDLAGRAPESMASGLERWVGELFTGGTVLLERAASGVLGVAGAVMGGIPGGALLVGTAVLSSFMISAQLPVLKGKLRRRMSREKLKKWLDMALRIKTAAGGWLKAQMKLSALTFLLVLGGFLLLRVKNPVFWALVTALVDAVPMLGTGLILIPWTLLSFALGKRVLALGLLGIYVTAVLTRSTLEPKLLGRHLGMNPLLTLMALYAGYHLWGVTGMIVAPILTVTARQIVSTRE